MSFRAEEGRRYGAVPPVQYPVASQNQEPYHPNAQRRNSFNTGDDSEFFDQTSRTQSVGTGRDELFTAGASNEPSQIQSGSAMAGYQHHYQTQTSPAPSSYNPQAFARTQTQSLPYRPNPSYNSTSVNRYPTVAGTSASYNQNSTNYTPAPYNPALYSATSPTTAPTRHGTYHGYSNYGQSYTSPTNTQSPSSFYSQQSGYSPGPQSTQAPSPYDQGLPSPQYSNSVSGTTTTASYEPSYSGYSNNSYYGGGSVSSNGCNSPAHTSYSGTTSQAPYPSVSSIPVGPNYAFPDLGGYGGLDSRSNSFSSPLPSPAASQLPQRHPTNAPLPSRPMADLPEEATWSPDVEGGMEDLMNDIESQLGRDFSQRSRPTPINGRLSEEELDKLRMYNSETSPIPTADSNRASRLPSTTSTLNQNNATHAYDGSGYGSDPEAEYGIAAMNAAEKEERRFSGGNSGYGFSAQTPAPQTQTLEKDDGGDSDNVPFDLGLFGGGYAPTTMMSYGPDFSSPSASGTAQPNQVSTSQQTYGGYAGYDSYIPFSEAGVDYEGTGGLQPPTTDKSVAYDEDGEQLSLKSRQSESDSPSKEENPDMPDMFFHPGISNRPLPAIPQPASDSSSMFSLQPPSRGHSNSLSAENRPIYQSDGFGGYVERSISMTSHSHTPPVHTPARSQTDAAVARRGRAIPGTQTSTPHPETYGAGTPVSLAYDAITLPRGRRKLNPSKLSPADFGRCQEPWALSGISNWAREMAEGENDLKRKTVEECLVKLFANKVPTMNIADAEALSARVVQSMFNEGILIPEEEWVKWGTGEISGVLWQLTGSGCYAPRLHENETGGRCYSYHCTRTVKKADLDGLKLAHTSASAPSWSDYYKLSKEYLESRDKKEVQRQNMLHEIVTGEEEYIGQLDVLRILYRDQLRQSQPPLIAPAKMEKFISAVFGRVDALQQCNKENLLAQLKYRQKDQGPFIIGFSDLFREWIRKAKDIYIAYSHSYPYAIHMVDREKSRNVLFNKFLADMVNHPLSRRLDHTTYIKAPITRLQRYTLLLGSVLRTMKESSEERNNLEVAIEEIKAVTLECDAKVAEMQKKVDMMELEANIVLRPGFHAILNLDHLGRELIHQGELVRVGSKGVRWVDAYALLLDHYFILAKKVEVKDNKTGKKYDVSKEPIPMPLLFLESSKDEPISRQKGLSTPLTRTAASGASGTAINKLGDRPTLDHVATSSSMSTIARLNSGDSGNDKILYPFRIKHLGHETYTLFAKDASTRDAWCQKIIEAKTRHAKALHAQNAEPFSLRVVADSAFQYDAATAISKSTTMSVRGTPLDRAIREMEKIYGPGRGPAAVCRAQVNCAAGFMAFGKPLIAIGTDYGVYIADATNPRGWTRTCQATRVTQIAILEEFSVCLLVANRELTSYPLDVIAPVSNYAPPAHDNSRRAPHRLAKDVSFFATARMKDRMLVFYKRKEGMHNTFNVLEPVFQRSAQTKRSLFGSRSRGSGNTETFRDFDQFYLPTECYSLNLFQTYIAVATAKGFELLTLDKKQPMSIPDLRQPSIANIASRIRDQRPLGMFKLNDQEFLLAYEDCAVYVDKHGDVSRTLIMEYSGKQKKAKAATMYGQYLVLFNEDYIEVRNAENGRLRQIIAGRDVRALDYGYRGPTGMSGTPQYTAGQAQSNQHGSTHHQPSNWTDPAYSKGTVKIAMSHPEMAGTQLVLELVLNEGHNE